MTKKDRSGLGNVYILVISIAVVITAAIWGNKTGSIVAPMNYVNVDQSIGFQYPGSLTPVDEDVASGVHVINLYPKGKENISREIISITTVSVDESADITEVAANYLEVSKSKIVKVDKDELIEARYIKYDPNGEVSYYNFFKDGARLDVVKFNQKVFDPNNPLIMRDNSVYKLAYSTVLGTMNFSPEL